jgi:hypothetical protein
MDANDEVLDGVSSLRAVISTVAASMSRIENFPDGHVLVGTAAFAHVQLMTLHAQAIEAAAESEQAITASAHLRPMLLAWCQMMALFREPNPNAAAIASLQQVCVDRLEHLRAVDPEFGEVTRIENALRVIHSIATAADITMGASAHASRGARAPGRGGAATLLDEAREWLRPTPRILAEFDEALAEADRLGPTPVLISEADGNGQVIYLAFSDEPREAANRICLQASRVLMHAWEQVAMAFGLDTARWDSRRSA